jgi:hypothetical protein
MQGMENELKVRQRTEGRHLVAYHCRRNELTPIVGHCLSGSRLEAALAAVDKVHTGIGMQVKT